MNNAEDVLAKYIFMKIGAQEFELEKQAVDPFGAFATLARTAKDFFVHTAPQYTLGAGIGGGALWWLLKRKLEHEEIKKRKALSALNKQIEKVKGI